MSADAAMAPVGEPAGWHGKLPSLGDFAARRLSPEFIAAWDGWLAAGLATLREQQPAQWLQEYLACPAWRFLLMPGVLPGALQEQALAGVLMPSVDRIGRYFPLTLIAPLPAAPRDATELNGLLTWLHDLDDLAADALQDDWPIDRLEAELDRCRPPAWPARPAATPLRLAAGQSHAVLPVAGSQALLARIAEAQALAFAQASQGQAFWWADGESGERRLLVTRGLPPSDQMRLLFGTAPAQP